MLKRRSEESGNGSGPFVLGRIEAQGGIAVQRFTTALRETFAGQLTIAPFDRRPCSGRCLSKETVATTAFGHRAGIRVY